MNKLTDTEKMELLRDILGNSDISTDEKIPETRILNIIYKIIHPDISCPHDDWEEEAIKLSKSLTLI